MQREKRDWLEVLNHITSEPEEKSYQSIDVVLDDEPQDFAMKVVLIGDGAVGKTAIRERYLGKGFSGRYLATIGADFTSKEDTFGAKNVKFQIWDLAGQPSFSIVRKIYYTGAKAAFVVCDVSEHESVMNINSWINELWKNNGRGPIPFLILGNKIDLRAEGIDCITDQELETIAKRLTTLTWRNFHFSVSYLPTSAKTGENITEAFKKLAVQVISQRRNKVKYASH